MPRFARNAAILAKIESVYGTDPTPTGAANSILVSDLSISPLNASNVKRDLIRPYFGGAEELVGVANVEVSFSVELAGAGSAAFTAGTAPAWGVLLRACGFAQTVSAGQPAVYDLVTPVSDSMTIYYHDDGVLHKVLGSRGNVDIKLGIGERPTMSFKFLGLDGGVTAAANPTSVFTAFQRPAVVTDPNTGDLLFGCTYAAGALSGGTPYVSAGLEIGLGNATSHTPLLGGESVDVTNREPSAKFMLDLTAAQEVTFMTNVKNNTTQSIGMQHGSAAGSKIIAYMPLVQLINPKKEDKNGRRLIGFDGRVLPNAGNDELKIVAA